MSSYFCLSLMLLVLILLFAFCSSSSSSSSSTLFTRSDANSSELILVQILFRHGDRTPNSFLDPNDRYRNYDFPEGIGGLTLKGKNLMYNYGLKLQSRYGQYIGKYINILNEKKNFKICLFILFFQQQILPPRM